MKEKIIYVAADGKEFYNKEECQAYENYENSFLRESNILFFDKKGKPLENLSSYKEIIALAYYFYIPDNESYRKFEKFNEDWGYDIPMSEGFWYWDSEEYAYVDIYKRRKEIINQIEVLEKEKDRICTAIANKLYKINASI